MTAPNTCPALGEGAGVSMLTLESQLGRHDCSCLRSQRKRPPFGVICTQAKMCIELIGWDAEASARRGLSHCQFETSCTSAPHDAAAPTVTGRARGWAVLAAELPVACRQRAEPVVTDGCAHPKERKVTAQSRRGGGTSFPQLGHGEHEKMSGDVVVLQCRVGSHGACMGSARAQREARGQSLRTS